jgi:hypothetical protein
MKGIIKYQQKFYKKAKDSRNVKEGDLIKLECKRKSDYFKYNGIYTVQKHRYIHIKKEGEITLALKLLYNVYYNNFHILVPTEKKKSLPMPVKEEKLCGYAI